MFQNISHHTCIKQSSVTCLYDYRPVALNHIAAKHFERLCHIKNHIPPALDNHQFAFKANKSTDNTISIAVHTVLEHLKQKNTHARLFFIEYSSATIILSYPINCSNYTTSTGFSAQICNWILSFLTNHTQSVRLGNNTSSILILKRGAPQGCVLSPILYTVHSRLCPIRYHFHQQIHRWHNGYWINHTQWWNALQRRGAKTVYEVS